MIKSKPGFGAFEHPCLEEVVPNCLVAFYDTRSESLGMLYYPIPAGEDVDEREAQCCINTFA